jgi:hypothetical protein
MPENYPEENIKHTEHGGSLKSRIKNVLTWFMRGTIITGL